MLTIGYRTDERIDEPGEVGAPGTVLDVFPVDAECPVRIEIDEGRIRSIRPFDPMTQRSHDEIDHLSLGSAAEPVPDRDGVPLLAHLPGATLLVEPDFAKRRQRTIDLIATMTARKRRLDPAHFVDTAT